MQRPSSISSPQRGRRTGVRPLAALVLASTLAACAAEDRATGGAMPPPQIPVATPLVQRVAVARHYPARVEAIDRVELRPRVSGYVERVLFEEGSVVEPGQLLLQIDARPYAAKLAEADAALDLARSDLSLALEERDRAARLTARKALPAQELDRRKAAAVAAEARVVAAAAARELAALDVSFTEVRAPIAGRIGRAEVTPGNLVSATSGGGTLLTTLVAVDPVYVTFDVDETMAAALATDANHQPVRFGVAGAADEREGKIRFLDNELGRGTGTLRVRAMLANPDGRLIPGMLGRATLAIDYGRESLLIDDKAIGADQDRRYVLVAGANGLLEYRPIETGALVGSLRIVESGLAPHDLVVVNGLMRVRAGALIEPVAVRMERAATGDYTPIAASLAAATE